MPPEPYLPPYTGSARTSSPRGNVKTARVAAGAGHDSLSKPAAPKTTFHSPDPFILDNKLYVGALGPQRDPYWAWASRIGVLERV